MSTQDQQIQRTGQKQGTSQKSSPARTSGPKGNQIQNRTARQSRTAKREVVVTDVDISFGNMVMLLVKLAFASIPAMIIIWIVMSVIAAMLMAVFGIGGSMLAGG